MAARTKQTDIGSIPNKAFGILLKLIVFHIKYNFKINNLFFPTPVLHFESFMHMICIFVHFFQQTSLTRFMKMFRLKNAVYLPGDTFFVIFFFLDSPQFF